MTVDELLQMPYWIIDILPAQVPRDAAGQYFAVERWFLQPERLSEIKEKHLRVILKLNCYRSISIDENRTFNPPPEQLAEEMRRRYLPIMTGESMILSEPDDTHMTVFNPDRELLDLIKTLAAGEGLYVWQPPE